MELWMEYNHIQTSHHPLDRTVHCLCWCAACAVPLFVCFICDTIVMCNACVWVRKPEDNDMTFVSLTPDWPVRHGFSVADLKYSGKLVMRWLERPEYVIGTRHWRRVPVAAVATVFEIPKCVNTLYIIKTCGKAYREHDRNECLENLYNGRQHIVFLVSHRRYCDMCQLDVKKHLNLSHICRPDDDDSLYALLLLLARMRTRASSVFLCETPATRST